MLNLSRMIADGHDLNDIGWGGRNEIALFVPGIGRILIRLFPQPGGGSRKCMVGVEAPPEVRVLRGELLRESNQQQDSASADRRTD